jgi:hypothetical protein
MKNYRWALLPLALAVGYVAVVALDRAIGWNTDRAWLAPTVMVAALSPILLRRGQGCGCTRTKSGTPAAE